MCVAYGMASNMMQFNITSYYIMLYHLNYILLVVYNVGCTIHYISTVYVDTYYVYIYVYMYDILHMIS